MENLAGNISFNHFSQTHKKEVNFQIYWVSIPTEPKAVDQVDRFSVTMRLFSIEDGSPHGKHLFNVVENNGSWICGEYQNQAFRPYDTDISREIAERVVNDYEQTLENMPEENDDFWKGL